MRNHSLRQAILEGGSSAITSRQVIQLATVGGANLLGRNDLGRIEQGAVADLVGLNVSDIAHAGALDDYLASVVLCGSNHTADLTIVNGKIVVRQGRLLTVDEDEIVGRANQAAKRLLAS